MLNNTLTIITMAALIVTLALPVAGRGNRQERTGRHIGQCN